MTITRVKWRLGMDLPCCYSGKSPRLTSKRTNNCLVNTIKLKAMDLKT